MKISLIEPPEQKTVYSIYGKELILSAVRTHYPKQPQLIVASILKKEANVKIIDMKINDSEKEQKYKEYPYGQGTISCYRKGSNFKSLKSICTSDIIGITSNFTRSSEIIIDIIKYLRKIGYKKKIIIGGSDATIRFDYYLKNGADIVILGEAENTAVKVIKALKKEKTLDNILGIAYKKGENIICNKKNKNEVDINKVPFPAFELVDIKKYTEAFEGKIPKNVSLPVGIIETSRGCYNNCDFCPTSKLKNPYRSMSTKRVEELLNHYENYKIKTLIIMENNIMSRLCIKNGRKKIIEMFDLMRKKGFAWEFGNGIEFGKFSSSGKIDYKLINRLFSNSVNKRNKLVGCYRALIPLETLYEKSYKYYKKLKPYNEEYKIIKAIVKTGLPKIIFSLIIGRDEDNETTLNMIKERVIEIKDLCNTYGVENYFALYLLTPLPGSKLYRILKDKFIYPIEKYPELYQFHTSVIGNKFYSPPELTFKKLELEKSINGEKADKIIKYGKYDN